MGLLFNRLRTNLDWIHLPLVLSLPIQSKMSQFQVREKKE
jgi:hypothetical protein